MTRKRLAGFSRGAGVGTMSNAQLKARLPYILRGGDPCRYCKAAAGQSCDIDIHNPGDQ